jgi:hypothetical protein
VEIRIGEKKEMDEKKEIMNDSENVVLYRN